ncbi:hypothetical protein RWE15_03715 [Virgibacillus halophilus]|uniref:Uncharacterized protein n=1 Tax=Tigheibacillus halophilus TaxID=361280 RepID=A0ABU5C336_9BACI|nr:hypothetical protein [Virgibacillus halophilus]
MNQNKSRSLTNTFIELSISGKVGDKTTIFVDRNISNVVVTM